MNKTKILLLENIHKNAELIFRKNGFEVENISESLNEEKLIKKLQNIDILGIRSKTQINEKIINNSNLKAIGAYCIGTNQIDLYKCNIKGVTVFNAPYSNTRSVVELAIGNMIFLIRGIFDKSLELHRGIWNKSAKNNYEIRGKKLGIIGYGNIGAQLSVLAESMGMKVLYYDIEDKLALGNAKRCDTMEDLLKNSDIISIHVDGRESNKQLIGNKEFKLMKDGVIFLNLSRGHIVDVDQLSENIQKGKISGAAIDVYPNEPGKYTEDFISSLQKLPNTILTPHIGGSTVEAQTNIANFVSEKIVDFMNNGNTVSSVNFPNLRLPELVNSHRLIHIHKNKPGILAEINHILAKNNINIDGQYLKTNLDIGYVITDIFKKYDKKIIVELQSIKNTIGFRILY